jgi:hypothetical protein
MKKLRLRTISTPNLGTCVRAESTALASLRAAVSLAEVVADMEAEPFAELKEHGKGWNQPVTALQDKTAASPERKGR